MQMRRVLAHFKDGSEIVAAAQFRYSPGLNKRPSRTSTVFPSVQLDVSENQHLRDQCNIDRSIFPAGESK